MIWAAHDETSVGRQTSGSFRGGGLRGHAMELRLPLVTHWQMHLSSRTFGVWWRDGEGFRRSQGARRSGECQPVRRAARPVAMRISVIETVTERLAGPRWFESERGRSSVSQPRSLRQEGIQDRRLRHPGRLTKGGNPSGSVRWIRGRTAVSNAEGDLQPYPDPSSRL